jgi:hypothetical protein
MIISGIFKEKKCCLLDWRQPHFDWDYDCQKVLSSQKYRITGSINQKICYLQINFFFVRTDQFLLNIDVIAYLLPVLMNQFFPSWRCNMKLGACNLLFMLFLWCDHYLWLITVFSVMICHYDMSLSMVKNVRFYDSFLVLFPCLLHIA